MTEPNVQTFIETWNKYKTVQEVAEAYSKTVNRSVTPAMAKQYAWSFRSMGYNIPIKKAGSREGGLKAAVTNKVKYGNNYYREIGSKGGKLGRTGGFYANRELARIAGAKGGKISRRTKQ